jgi:hypothetical protein
MITKYYNVMKHAKEVTACEFQMLVLMVKMDSLEMLQIYTMHTLKGA